MKRILPLLLAATVFTPPAWADIAGWTTGLEITLEAAAGLRGGAQRGQTLHGLTLSQVAWNQPKTVADGGVRYRALMSALALKGHGPSAQFLGDLQSASNIEGPTGARLYAWWLW